MAETQGNPFQAPSYARHRSGIAALDVAAITKRERGINMASHAQGHVQVVPSSGANPDVEVLWWSEEASQFISENPAIAKSGAGIDTPYEFTVEARGRIMFVSVTGGATGSIEIMVSGFNIERV